MYPGELVIGARYREPSRGTLGVEGDARGERRLIVASSGSL